MASLRDIRNRIKSIKSTEKITKAMKMISAVKLRKNQNNFKNYSLYYNEIKKKIFDLSRDNAIIGFHDFFLFKNGYSDDICVIIISSDKGLCGSFNTVINKKRIEFFNSLLNKNKKINYLIFGKKCFDLIKKENSFIIEKYFDLENLLVSKKINNIINSLVEDLKNDKYFEVFVIYNKFETISTQKIMCEKIFPITLDDSLIIEEKNQSDLFNYEGDCRKIVEKFFVNFFFLKLYIFFLNSILSEHSYRMKAMENANKNSKEIINKLVLFYNRSRQSKITTELIEIISGSESS